MVLIFIKEALTFSFFVIFSSISFLIISVHPYHPDTFKFKFGLVVLAPGFVKHYQKVRVTLSELGPGMVFEDLFSSEKIIGSTRQDKRPSKTLSERAGWS